MSNLQRGVEQIIPSNFERGHLHFFKDVDELPCKGTYDNLIDLIWKKEHWIEQIFDKKMSGLMKGKLEGLFLQLIANILIGLVRKNGTLT